MLVEWALFLRGVNTPLNSAEDSPREVSLFDKMVVASILRFFPRFGDLDALCRILESLTDENGQERKILPEFLRPHLLGIRWEMERSYSSQCSFLVNRVKIDILKILEPFTDFEAQKTLEEIRVLVEINDL